MTPFLAELIDPPLQLRDHVKLKGIERHRRQRHDRVLQQQEPERHQ